MGQLFRVKTIFGTTYTNITGWKKWAEDEDFFQFDWGTPKKTLVLRIKDIQAIEQC